MSVNIISYSKPKDNGSGGSGSNSVYKTIVRQTQEYVALADRLSQKRKIWGHPFDGTQDVDGDFSGKGNWVMTNPVDSSQLVRFNHSGNINKNGRFIGRKTDFEIHDAHLSLSGQTKEKLTIGTDYINADNNLTIEAKNELTLKAKSMNQAYEEGHLDLGIKGDLKAGTLFTNNMYDYGAGQIYVGSPLLLDGGLDLNGDLTVKNMYSQNITNDQEIRTKDLTVTGAATFFSLIVAEIQAVGGQIILSAADFRIDAVENGRTNVPNEHNFSVSGNGWIDGYYRTKYIYQLAVDSDGQKIDCKWKPFDQIISYTSNISEDSEFSTRNWWTLVLDVQENVNHLINNEIKPCHRLEIVEAITGCKYSTGGDVSETINEWINPAWGAVNPLEGDNCALLGSHDPYRQNAIVMAAYNWIDLRLKAPLIAQYSNICGFELPEPISYFAANGNRITGSLVANSGKSVTDLIDQVVKGRQTYMHQAWADSEDGALNFSKVMDREYAYEGLASNMTSSDEDLIYSDYLWMPSNSQNKLLPTRERLYLSDDDNLYLDVEYLAKRWTGDYHIEAEIFTYGGATTTRQVNQYTNDGSRVRYAGLVQKGWSGVQSHAMQYCGATIKLLDSTGKVVDSRSIQLVMDAGAVLSITDSIRARVADTEGNIASVAMTSRQILTRLTGLESSLQLALNDDSAELRIEDIEGRINQIKLDVQGLQATIDGGLEYDDNWIRQRLAEYKLTVDGFSAQLETIQTNIYDDTWVVTKFHNLDVSIDGLKQSIRSIETQGYDDSSIIEKYNELSATVDGLNVRVGQIETWGDAEDATEGQLAILSNQVYARVVTTMSTTGIDITSGRVLIQADNTDIVGNLNITEANNSGVTIYDSYNSPVINLQPWNIGNFEDFSPFAYMNYYASMAQPNGGDWYFWFDEQCIGKLDAGKTLTIDNIVINMLTYVMGASTQTGQNYPTSVRCELQIRTSATLETGRSVEKSYTLTTRQSGTSDRFVVDSQTKHNTLNSAYYWVGFICQGSGTISSGYTAMANVKALVRTQQQQATMLAKDGMYVNTSANKVFWVGNDGIILRQSDREIVKLNENGLFRGFRSGTTGTGTGTGTNSGTETIKWFSFYNYRPCVDPAVFGRAQYMNVPTINEYKYCYCIDPFVCYGDLLFTFPASDSNYNPVDETWILLPKQAGTDYSLPIGWLIKIIYAVPKKTMEDYPCKLYVSTQERFAYGDRVILNSDRDWLSQVHLTRGSNDSDTFLWTGTFWKCLHNNMN